MLGIAVINYNTYEKTIDCIESIRKYINTDYKIYLLDNASPNNSGSILAQKYSGDEDIDLTLSKENLGYARGNNVCISKMIEDQCNYGIVSNNDIVFGPNIDKLIDDLRENDNLLLVGPKIYLPDGGVQPSIKIKKYGKLEYLRKYTYLNRIFSEELQKEYKENEAIDKFTTVEWVVGAFFAFSVKKMKKIGLFDPNTFLFYEEDILAAKAKKANLLLGYDPNVSVMHYHGASTGGVLNVNTVIASTISEQYYFNTYTDYGSSYSRLIRWIRFLEVALLSAKKNKWGNISIYVKGVRKGLKK